MGEKFDTPTGLATSGATASGPPPGGGSGVLPLDENDPRRYTMYGGPDNAFLEGPEGPGERQARWDRKNTRWVDVKTGDPMPPGWGAGLKPPI